MPQAQQINLRVKGLYTAPNDYSGVPDGALDVADNINIDQESLAEPRRGFALTGELPLSSDRVTSFTSYQDARIFAFGDDQLGYDAGAGPVPYDGTYPPPDPNVADVRFVEANKNLYFTTAQGLYKLDAYNSTPVKAGVPKGLDLELALTGTSGFFSPEVAVEITGTTVSGSPNLTLLSDPTLAGVTAGMYVSGAGIPVGTTVLSITPRQVALITTGDTIAGSDNIVNVPTIAGLSNNMLIEGTGIVDGARIDGTSGAGPYTVSMNLSAISSGTGVTLTFYTDPIITLSNNATASASVVGLKFSTGSQVAYRLVWGIRDANSNVILSAPSQFATITNETGGTRNVIATTSIPDGITINHFYQLYRSDQTPGADITPLDELQLVYEGNPSEVQISNGYLSITDITPDSLRGATLYTSLSQQGISQANDNPPLCRDMCVFKNCVLYANTTSPHRFNLTVLAIKRLLVATVTGNTTSGNANITNVASVADIAVTQPIYGSGVPQGARVLSISGAGPYTVQMDMNATATQSGATFKFYSESAQGIDVGHTITIGGTTYTAGTTEIITPAAFPLTPPTFRVFADSTPSQNIADTVNSLLRVINRSATNTTVYAYLLSGPTDLPGQILLEEKGVGGAPFVLTGSNGQAFNPFLPTSGTTVVSTQSVNKNGIIVSKANIPEAAPGINLLLAGNAAKNILRIIPLRDYVIILKEDGVFRLSGHTISTFNVTPFDLTTKLIAPNTAVSLSNEVWGLFDQGVCSVSDTGVNVRSRSIEDVINGLVTTALPTLQSVAFGIGYETDRKYILALPTALGDTFCQQQYVFPTFTNAWSRWTRACTAGFVDPATNTLVLGNAHNSISEERKTNSYRDYVDEPFNVDITGFDEYSVTLSDVTIVRAGDVLYAASTISSVITAVDYATSSVTVQDLRTWPTATVSVFPAINCVIQWKPSVAGNPAFVRQYSEGAVLFKRTRFNEASLGFYTDVQQAFQEVPITGPRIATWGSFPWGQENWGGINRPRGVRYLVPRDMQMASQLSIRLKIRAGWSNWACEGIAVTILNANQEIAS